LICAEVISDAAVALVAPTPSATNAQTATVLMTFI
jgi:hypothetical protein